MNIYCKSCGAPNAYGSKKPKFCNNCGAPLGGEAKASAPVKKQVKPQKQPVPQESYDYEDDIDDSPQIPNISRLEADIDTGQMRGVKLGEIAGTASAEEETYIRPQDDNKITSEQALEQLKREGGSIRGQGNSA